MILLLLLKKLAYYLSHWGKIQGDGRKFLDRFKSYSGSQISSESVVNNWNSLPPEIVDTPFRQAFKSKFNTIEEDEKFLY